MPTLPPIGGPVPAGNRVVIGVEAQDDNGVVAAIDGVLVAVSPQAVTINIEQVLANKRWNVRVDPPADLSEDTTVHIADSDDMPAAEIVIDWDGPVVVPAAAKFGFTVSFEPVV